MKSQQNNIFEDILSSHGYRVTAGRLELLKLLKNSKSPVSVSDIHDKINTKIDKVTLYRALEDFVNSKIILKLNLGSQSAYYEYARADHHHHHLICNSCGKIEDVESCDIKKMEKSIVKNSKQFSDIVSHSVEFFGICKSCS